MKTRPHSVLTLKKHSPPGNDRGELGSEELLNNIDALFNSDLSQKERHEIDEIIHFYYCLNVAIGINKRYAPRKSENDRLIFIQDWLLESQKKKTFRNLILEDLTWLRQEIARGRTFSEMQHIIAIAYGMFTSLQVHQENKNTEVSRHAK